MTRKIGGDGYASWLRTLKQGIEYTHHTCSIASNVVAVDYFVLATLCFGPSCREPLSLSCQILHNYNYPQDNLVWQLTLDQHPHRFECDFIPYELNSLKQTEKLLSEFLRKRFTFVSILYPAASLKHTCMRPSTANAVHPMLNETHHGFLWIKTGDNHVDCQ